MPSVQEKLRSRIVRLIAKGEKVLESRRHLRRSKKSERITRQELDEEAGRFVEWQSQTVSFLVDVLGRDHVYTRLFANYAAVKLDDDIEEGLGVLRAVREDLEGGDLTDIRTLISAEVFTDFLEMAEHLHKTGYKDPAASLVGAVLEDGLRRIANNHGVKRKSREDLSSLNHKLANAGTYGRLTQKQVQVWTEVRNSADHGHFDEYTADDVANMISGVGRFLDEHLR